MSTPVEGILPDRVHIRLGREIDDRRKELAQRWQHISDMVEPILIEIDDPDDAVYQLLEAVQTVLHERHWVLYGNSREAAEEDAIQRRRREVKLAPDSFDPFEALRQGNPERIARLLETEAARDPEVAPLVRLLQSLIADHLQNPPRADTRTDTRQSI